MRDRIIEDRIARKRKDFIRYITNEKSNSIYALASSYHDSTPCTVVAISHRSFNVYVSVQFDTPPTSNSAVR
ncbi:hypothetical protein B0J15DRAFT_483559, partial [Fusarium solani]